jgi:peptidylprolyl isomerase
MKNQNSVIFIIVIIIAGGSLVAIQQGILPNPLKDSRLVDNSVVSNVSAPGLASTNGENFSGQENWAQSLTQPGNDNLSYENIVRILSNVDVNQRRELIENEKGFHDFIKQESLQISLLAAARANNIDKDENSKFLLQRNAENAIREVYLSKLINTKIPADFPSDEQIEQYYQDNKEKLIVEERVSVWQIFLPVTEGMSEGDITALENQANKLANDIRSNTTEFTTAALSYSSHQPSKLNGGHMGILKVSELMPGIHEVLIALDEGEVSKAVKSEMGFHILKRDEIIPQQSVSLNQVRDQIKNLLINQFRVKLRDEILKLASETYPTEVNNSAVEEWRNRLKSEI